MSQKELLSAFQSGLSQSFSLVEQMSEDQRQAAAVALQGLLEKTPIASVINRDSKITDATTPKNVTAKDEKNNVTRTVDGKVYKLPKRGRPSRAEFIHVKNKRKGFLDSSKSLDLGKHSKSKDSEETQTGDDKSNKHVKGAACDVCGRYFSQRGNMMRHRMRHTGERPWKCEMCGIGFIEKKSLVLHNERKHSPHDDDIIFCGICGLKFRSKLHAAKHSCLRNKAASAEEDKSGKCSKRVFTVAIKRDLIDGQEKRIKQEDKQNSVTKNHNGNEETDAHDLAEIEKQITEYEGEEDVFGESVVGGNGGRSNVPSESDNIQIVTMTEQTDDVDGSDREDNQTDFDKSIARKIMSAIAKEHLTSQNTHIKSNLLDQSTTSSDIQSSESPIRETDKMVKSVVKEEKMKKARQSVSVLTSEKTLKTFQVPKQSCSNWECPQCPHKAKEFRSLWIHLKSHDESGSLQCMYCDLNLASISNLQRHYISTHDTPLFQCCRCAKSFRTYISYEQHMKCCMDGILDTTASQQCPICEKQYSSAITLRAHIDGKHFEKKYKCSFCSRSFNFSSNLIRHTKLHTGDRQHECKLCKKGFIERKCLVTHMMRKHPDAPIDEQTEGGVNCNVCGKGFGSKALVNVHMSVHTKQANFKCKTCGRAFSLKANLSRHELTHTGAKPYLCSVCGKAFTEKRSVTVHMRLHTGERPFKCPHCPKAFSQSGNLEAHLPVHTKVRKFLCTECGASFLRRTHYAQHMRKHNGPPDVSCPHCPAMFYRGTDLRRHMSTHNTTAATVVTQNKGYECSVCGASFSESVELITHHKIHFRAPRNSEDRDADAHDTDEEEQNDLPPYSHDVKEEEEEQAHHEHIKQIIEVPNHGDPSQLNHAENQVIYVQEADPLVLFAGADPILETKPGTEPNIINNAALGTESQIESQLAVSAETGMELGEGLNIAEQSSSEAAIAFHEVSEIEAGDQVIEIDGFDGVDPSRLAFQQLADQSGYYVIIHGPDTAIEAEQSVITN